MGVSSRASLHPPAHGGGGAGAGANGPRPSWILLDLHAYIADRRNSSTATCKFKGDKELQVTFFPARPPRVSYFCVHCSGLKSSAYAAEPKIIATDANFVLLRIALGSYKDLYCHDAHEYFIYRADGGGLNGRPLLEQLPHPSPYIFHDEQVGLLGCGTDYTIVALRDDSAAIYRRYMPFRPGHYDVCTFHSRDKVWTVKPVNVSLQEQRKQSGDDEFRHVTTKVITIGGERGTMAFVDLWRGILQYDVFGGSTSPGYTPLPEICLGMRDYSVSPSLTRDIAVVEGRIKYVEMVEAKMSTGSDGWKASTWSMPNLEDDWLPPCELEACNICDDKNMLSSQLLPKLNYKKGEPQPTLASLSTEYPTLSLYEDDIVYFMTKVEPTDTKACMIAVDMKSRKLEGLTEFAAERMRDLMFARMQSKISSDLKVVPGTIMRTKDKGKKYFTFGLQGGVYGL